MGFRETEALIKPIKVIALGLGVYRFWMVLQLSYSGTVGFRIRALYTTHRPLSSSFLCLLRALNAIGRRAALRSLDAESR